MGLGPQSAGVQQDATDSPGCSAEQWCVLQVVAEFLADVPDDAPVWGWKEPQAIYTLPFLTQVGGWVGLAQGC